jgi:hypothetical protein
MNEHIHINLNESVFNEREGQNEKVKQLEMFILQTCFIKNKKNVD